MKTGLLLAAVYLAAIGAAELVSTSSSNSPTADTVASFPSVGSIVAKSASTGTQAMLDLLAAGALGYYAYYHA